MAARYFAEKPEVNPGALAKWRVAATRAELHSNRSVASRRISAPASALRSRKSSGPPRFQVSLRASANSFQRHLGSPDSGAETELETLRFCASQRAKLLQVIARRPRLRKSSRTAWKGSSPQLD